MKKILIVHKRSLQVLHKYDADAPSISSWGGQYGDEMQCEHVACPSPLDPDCVKVVLDQMDNMMVVEDLGLIEAKKEVAWQALRSERNRRLAECDWTQTVDAPLNEQDKRSWQEYRKALRDLPESTLDPRRPNWPDKPDPQI